MDSTIWGVERRRAWQLGGAMGVLTALILWAELGMDALVHGFAYAILPLPLYLWLALWLDRFDPEPARLLAKAFAWGAIVAVFFSLIGNGLFAELVGSQEAMAVISAPVLEELTKGLAILLLFHQQRHHFDNVTDGVVYAAMVGLGFATTENVLYYGRALIDGTAALTFLGRGVLSPFAHPLFTALTGIGVGIASESGRRWLRLAAPLAGLSAAILLHALWNLAAILDLFFPVYLVIMVPAFLAVLAVVRHSIHREEALIRDRLEPYVRAGVLRAADLEAACRTGNDWSLRALVRSARERQILRRERELHHAAAALAFHHWRVARGISRGPEADATWEAECLAALTKAADGQCAVRGTRCSPSRHT